MNLPKPLSPWAKYLDMFPDTLSLALAPLITRIALLIGPLEKIDNSGKGEPDGFDGITRKGSYDKLLISEWLLLEEMPDEFARRASMGEHVFLKTARREPGLSRGSIALFDAGPDQIGTPRIAHIAVLIVLAQRAELANAKFGWACLQEPKMPIYPGLSPREVEKLLSLRTLKTIANEDLEEWQSRLVKNSLQQETFKIINPDWENADDLWLIGSPTISRLPSASKFSRLLIRPGIDPNISNLFLTVKSGSKESLREVVLDLPDERTCIRLIRSPFESATRKPTTSKINNSLYKPASRLVFSSFNRKYKLFARNTRGDIISYPIAERVSDNCVRPKRLTTKSKYYDIFSVGFCGYLNVFLSKYKNDGRMLLQYTNSFNKDLPTGNYRVSELYTAFSSKKPKCSDYLAPIFSISNSQIAFVDELGTLFQLNKLNRRTSDFYIGEAQIKTTDVIAINIYQGKVLYYVNKGISGDYYFNRLLGDEQAKFPLEFAVHKVLIGYSDTRKIDVVPVIAIETNNLEWQILSELAWPVFKEQRTVTISTGGEVIGIHCGLRLNIDSLVVLEANCKEVNIYSSDGIKTKLLTTSTLIKYILFFRFDTRYHNGDCLAYFTENNELTIYSMTLGSVLNKIFLDEKP